MTPAYSAYLDKETYRRLYKRFFEGHSPQDLLDLTPLIKDKNVLDLCAGDGRLSLEAINRGAKIVWAVEREPAMIEGSPLWIARNDLNVSIYLGTVQAFLEKYLPSKNLSFDSVFCQQAVNYWLNKEMAELVSRALKRRGVFVFNTFHNKPSKTPMVKEYEMDGFKFAEVSWVVGDIVHHVQIREGMGSHTTVFRWLSPEYLEDILCSYFFLTNIRNGSSSLYRCVKK